MIAAFFLYRQHKTISGRRILSGGSDDVYDNDRNAGLMAEWTEAAKEKAQQ